MKRNLLIAVLTLLLCLTSCVFVGTTEDLPSSGEPTASSGPTDSKTESTETEPAPQTDTETETETQKDPLEIPNQTDDSYSKRY